MKERGRLPALWDAAFPGVAGEHLFAAHCETSSLRLNPDYEVRPAAGDSVTLWPATGELRAKSFDGPSWELVRRFREPRPFGRDRSEEAGAFLRGLVLAGVLQTELDGRFAGGIAAFDRLSRDGRVRPGSTVDLLSLDAVTLVAGAPPGALDGLALLYMAGRLPASAAVKQAIGGSTGDLLAFLRMTGSTPSAACLRRDWTPVTAERRTGWLFWRHRRRRAARPRWKIYVSPRPEALADAIEALLPLLAESPVPMFKIGSDVHGVLRPDKFVLYCASPDDVAETGRRLAGAVRGLAVHGVPFTAPLTGDGLLSWGLDPPPRSDDLSSWRAWACAELAVALDVSRGWETGRRAAFAFAYVRAQAEAAATC